MFCQFVRKPFDISKLLQWTVIGMDTFKLATSLDDSIIFCFINEIYSLFSNFNCRDDFVG